MTRLSPPRLIVLSAIIVALVANAVIFGGGLFSWASDRTAPLVAVAARWIGMGRTIISIAIRRGELAGRIAQLEEENARLQSFVAQTDELRREVAFYRDVAALSPRPAVTPIHAGIFTYGAVVGVRQAVINRGAGDGIAVGDVVMTARSELVGVVQTVFEQHAVVRRIQDLGFDVTANVVGSDVAGLARSDGTGSLLLDLVRKDEVVAEGARVVTSGDDRFPAGLIIGTVRSVDHDAATLFQIVRLAPAIPDSVNGSVLIVRP